MSWTWLFFKHISRRRYRKGEAPQTEISLKRFPQEEILVQSYLCGLYEERVVGTENGRCYLDRAGFSEDPYSLFSEEQKCERKRRKQKQDLLQRVCGYEVPLMQANSNGMYFLVRLFNCHQAERLMNSFFVCTIQALRITQTRKQRIWRMPPM